MTPRAASPDARWPGTALVAITAIGWALNWPAVKLLLREWPPLFSRGLAGVAGAIVLAGVAAARRESPKVPRGAIVPLLWAAFTNVFAWMGFSTLALEHLRVSEAALLVYTMPLWAALLAWPILGARPTTRGIAALLLGLAGIVVLFGDQRFALGRDRMIGVALALAAATLFALGGVMTKAPLPIAPITRVAWQVGLGCLPMVVLGWILERPALGALTRTGWTALIYMAIVPMAACYLAWFAALSRLPVATAAMGTLLVPIIGSVAAAVALGEPLGGREVVAAAFTLAGVALALQEKKRPVRVRHGGVEEPRRVRDHLTRRAAARR